MSDIFTSITHFFNSSAIFTPIRPVIDPGSGCSDEGGSSPGPVAIQKQIGTMFSMIQGAAGRRF